MNTIKPATPLPWFAVTDRGVLGAFSQFHSGPYEGKWRFLPYCQHAPSRKAWDTREQALPRWAKSARIVQAANAAAASVLLRELGEAA
jgi:hypothetical protein